MCCYDELTDRELLIKIKRQLDEEDTRSLKAGFVAPFALGAGWLTSGVLSLGGFTWDNFVSGNNAALIFVGAVLMLFTYIAYASSGKKRSSKRG